MPAVRLAVKLNLFPSIYPSPLVLGWLNDNAINYLGYWEVSRSPRIVRDGMHFFNSFFMSRLFGVTEAKVKKGQRREDKVWESMGTSTPGDIWDHNVRGGMSKGRKDGAKQ